ncbi:MAG: Hsp20/alpha crystallin family protein [Flavobacteriales bacterium]|nr:Hsp20/alpha crystallin family protein [Flavobacteriales bacterium]
MDHSPRVNIVESNDDYRVEMQAPGFDKKDLKVEMLNDTLTIRGEHTEEEQGEDKRWTRREFARSAFERSFVLPQSVQADAIKAEYVNGVLQLTIPKSEEAKTQDADHQHQIGKWRAFPHWNTGSRGIRTRCGCPALLQEQLERH